MPNISSVNAIEIIDSRGNPTIEVDLSLKNGVIGRASVPSGASTGAYEAVELRDNDLSRYNGKGVLKACNNINNEISAALHGLEITQLNTIDEIIISLDGSIDKSRLGANTLLGVSLAAARAASKHVKTPLYKYLGGNEAKILPVPMMNIINGGAHANNSIDFQEFMIMPIGAETFTHALQIGVEVFHALKSILDEKGLSTTVGDEGGFAPELSNTDEALQLILQSIEKAGYRPNDDILLALDCAASEYFVNGKYNIVSENKSLSSIEKIEYLESLVNQYPIFSIEDGMDQDDWEGWSTLTKKLGDKCQLVGDDLFVTNEERLNKGVCHQVANSILIKPNQIGTLSETLNTIKIAQKSCYGTVISHRSGETSDPIIADISVATSAKQIKAGSLSRSERLAKYNRLTRIEKELGSNAIFAGWTITNNFK